MLTDPNLKTQIVTSGLDFPTSMTLLGSNDFLILEKNTGLVKRIIGGNIISEPLLQIDVSKKDEGGLLAVAVSKIIEKNDNENNDNENNDLHIMYSYHMLHVNQKN